MRLPSLEHLVRAIHELSPGGEVTVVGSSALLGQFPELGEEDGPLSTSYDADVIPEPFSEDIGTMLHEALGEDRRFHLIHGYHADILRPKIGEQFPKGWRERRIPLPGCDGVYCLDPHDLAACKCLVGREKDLNLVVELVKHKIVDPNTIEERIRAIDLPGARIIKADQNLKHVNTRIQEF